MKLQESIELKLRSDLKPAQLDVINESHLHSSGLGAESHFKVLVVSEAFQGLSRVRRQQKVYGLLAQELKNGVHALSLRLLTHAEWEQGGGEGFQSPNCHSRKTDG
jgi:BolA family transcriptional regulator, general stress-responsive regulator